MWIRSLTLPLAMTACLLIGCGDNSPGTPAPATPGTPATPATPGSTAGSTSSTDAAKALSDSAKKAQEAAAKATAELTAKAQTLADQVKKYIDDKKLDQAETAFKKLEELKDQLPADWKSKIENLRTILDTAKTAGAIKLPSL